MPDGRIHRILAPSFVDGPGSRMAVFMQGCDLACLHCHNPETRGSCRACGDCAACVAACPHGALEARPGRGPRHDPALCQACDRCQEACPAEGGPRTRTLSPGALLEAVAPWVPYLDGLTFSGGECTLQADFLLEALPLLRRATGLGALLDTNGRTDPGALDALLEVADGLLFDLKALDPELHRALTGADPGPVLANLDRAAALGKVVEVRFVVVPGWTDTREEVEGVARLAALAGAPLRLSPFRSHGVKGPLAGLPSPDPARMATLQALADAQGARRAS